MENLIDRTQIVYEFLTASSPLATEIGTNLWSPIAHRSWDGGTKAIVFHQDVSDSHITGAVNTAQFVFKCYGGSDTWTSARTLFRLLYDRLQMASETVTSGTIISARLLTDSQLPPEIETKYKAHMAQFLVTFDGA